VGGGYPLYLADGNGVTSVQVTLQYNPNLLQATGATGSHFTLSASSTPGNAVLVYSGPALATAPNTPVTVGFITANVPGGTAANPTPYKAKDVLHLTGASINGGAIKVATGDALHMVSYVGDADGNGGYSSNDAVLITRAALQTDSGFTAYPLVDPVIVGDTDGAGFIPADAPLQANEAGVGFATANLSIPPVPSGVVFQPIANNVDPQLSVVSSQLSVGNSGNWQRTTDNWVSVNLDDAHPAGSTGLTEAHLALTYDPRFFTVSAADIAPGSLLAAGSGWSVEPTINPVTGQIAIALSSTTPITEPIGGSLVTIRFHQIGSGEPGGVSPRSSESAINLVASVNPTGQQVVFTELEDAQGTFTLSPAPGNSEGIIDLTAPPTPVAAGTTTVVMLSSADKADHATDAPLPAVGTDELAVVPLPSEASAQASVVPSRIVLDPDVGDASPHGALIAATTSAAGLISAVTLQVSNAAIVNIQIAAGQHLTDQFFQSLVRATTNPGAVISASTMRDAIDHVLAGQWLLPELADTSDCLNMNEAMKDAQWQVDLSSMALSNHGSQHNEITQQTACAKANEDPAVTPAMGNEADSQMDDANETEWFDTGLID
jgi:hypothetical protein